MKTQRVLIALLAAAIALPLGANATEDRASGTLAVSTTLSSAYRFGPDCPPEQPSNEDCVTFTSVSGIPGLGRATVTYVKSFDDTICPGGVVQQKTTLIDVAGKGRLKVAMDFPVCSNVAPSSVVNHGTIVEGTGLYAGASGTLRVASAVHAPACGGSGCRGMSTDAWTGSIAVPGRDFDVTPPAFQAVPSKTIKAPTKAKTVRVRYSAKAQDAVDGALSAKCKPGSGSRFKVGRTTRVTCSAEDTSANVATTSFRVKVTKRR